MSGVELSPRPATEVELLVFDTSPLIHFARQNWFGVLKAVVGDRKALIPDVVVDELTESAARDDRVKAALEATWIERRELRTPEEIATFAQFAAVLVRGAGDARKRAVLTATLFAVRSSHRFGDECFAGSGHRRGGVAFRRVQYRILRVRSPQPQGVHGGSS